MELVSQVFSFEFCKQVLTEYLQETIVNMFRVRIKNGVTLSVLLTFSTFGTLV